MTDLHPDPIRARALVAYWLHVRVNHLAWRFARPPDHVCTDKCEREYERWENRRRQMFKSQHRLYSYKPDRDSFHGSEWGAADRIDRRHPLWRLNDWLAKWWTDEWPFYDY